MRDLSKRLYMYKCWTILAARGPKAPLGNADININTLSNRPAPRRSLVFGFALAAAVSALSFQSKAAMEEASGDIVDVAVAAGNFNTLVQAVQAAGLVDTLKGEGPFTVFAPTDEAFAKIPEADLQALLADRDALTRVLTYHVVPGKVMAEDVVKLTSAETVEGESITIDASSGVKVDDANVVATDVLASNGVIHVIDTVIMPN